MARLGIPPIEAIIRPCGRAFAKARHIRGLSRILETATAAPSPGRLSSGRIRAHRSRAARVE
jgi:hypothetical protein